MAATVWKGYISFGLVSFPVRLFAAARPKGIHFHMLHKKDLSRIKEVFYCAEEDKPVSRDEIVKGTEVSKGEYVVVTDKELKEIAPPTASTMDILQFVPASDVDPLYLESSYYVAPEEAVTKPYFLLLEAMSETGQDAVAKIAMHGREHIVILRPSKGGGLVLHTMYFNDELQKANAPSIPKSKQTNAKEIELAKTLIGKLTGPFKPEQYHDEYRANVERLIQQKQRGEKVTAVKQPKARPVVNIMEALQRSLKESGRTAVSKGGRKTSKGKSKAA
jgi:DNA end-binding protein Ku